MTQAMQQHMPQFTIRHRIVLDNGRTIQVLKRGGVTATKGNGASSLSGTDIELSTIPDDS